MAQVSLTNVANMAMALIGQERIARLDDSSKPARLANEFLPQVRDACLVRHPWNFAIARTSLPALATAPAFGFSRAFERPADCLRVLTLNGANPHEPFQIEGSSILCSLEAPLGIRYIRQVADAGSWSPLFVDLVAAELARRLCIPLSADKSQHAQLMQMIEQLERRARSTDAAEGTPMPAILPADDLILARL
jgi:hypothetical protein